MTLQPIETITVKLAFGIKVFSKPSDKGYVVGNSRGMYETVFEYA